MRAGRIETLMLEHLPHWLGSALKGVRAGADKLAIAHPELGAFESLRLASPAFADGARWRPDLPTVNVGTRGIAALEFRVRTAAKDLHSGRYGGIAPNAAQVAARLVASLHRER